MANRSLTVSFSDISCCELSNSSLYKCFIKPLLHFSSCNRYVYCELVAKDALASFFVPTYLQPYVDDFSKVFIYISEQVERFGLPHLRGAGWYLDCRVGYTPLGEEALLSLLFVISPIEPVVYEEEPSQPAPVQKPKRVRGKKGKDGAASTPATQSSAPAI